MTVLAKEWIQGPRLIHFDTGAEMLDGKVNGPFHVRDSRLDHPDYANREWCWTLTHIPSGRRIDCFDSEAKALRFAEWIADLCDWDKVVVGAGNKDLALAYEDRRARFYVAEGDGALLCKVEGASLQ